MEWRPSPPIARTTVRTRHQKQKEEWNRCVRVPSKAPKSDPNINITPCIPKIDIQVIQDSEQIDIPSISDIQPLDLLPVEVLGKPRHVACLWDTTLICCHDSGTMTSCNLNYDEESTYRGHTAAVLFVEEFIDDSFLTCSEDTTIRLWDTSNFTCKVFQGHSGPVLRVCTLAGQFASGSRDRTVRIWNSETGDCCHKIDDVLVNWMASISNTSFIFGSRRGTIALWRQNFELAVFENHGNFDILAADVNGSNLCLGTKSGKVLQYELPDDCCLHLIHTYQVEAAVSVLKVHLSSVAIVGCTDGAVRGLNLESNDQIFYYNAHGGWIMDLKFTSDFSHIISCSNQGEIGVYELGNATYNVDTFHTSPILKSALFNDSILVTYGNDDESFSRHLIENGKIVKN